MSVITYSFAKLGVHPGDALVQALDQRAMEVASRFGAQGLVNTLWGLSIMSHTYHAPMHLRARRVKKIDDKDNRGDGVGSSANAHGAIDRTNTCDAASGSEAHLDLVSSSEGALDAASVHTPVGGHDSGAAGSLYTGVDAVVTSEPGQQHNYMGSCRAGPGAKAVMRQAVGVMHEMGIIPLSMIITSFQRFAAEDVDEAVAVRVWARASQLLHGLDHISVANLWAALQNLRGKGAGGAFVSSLVRRTRQCSPRMTQTQMHVIVHTCGLLKCDVPSEIVDRMHGEKQEHPETASSSVHALSTPGQATQAKSELEDFVPYEKPPQQLRGCEVAFDSESRQTEIQNQTLQG